VPDSPLRFTLTELRNPFFAPDWHPEDHPAMPMVVAQGRKPDVRACGFCHRADGSGGPENASLASLPYAYLMQQMADYRNGSRSMAELKRAHQHLMNNSIKALTEDEMVQAAKYFSSIKPRENIKVVESANAPVTYIANWFLAPKPSGETEALGMRIIEVPDDVDRFESRDGRATFTAYVPVGSVAKGEELSSGLHPEKVLACAFCHGLDLRGTDLIPPIAGRSPSYLFRQLFEFQNGVRHGKDAGQMSSILESLNQEDLLNIAAYLGSLPR
jgi:cytochrome c553